MLCVRDILNKINLLFAGVFVVDFVMNYPLIIHIDHKTKDDAVTDMEQS